ncbi:unnamed protein product [Clonostachys byssicola]|uniref:Uncharacterized protein n=1 Tax=Clonostachys byssicola TaxID=160290 RepID=A0A9N9U980_9HYPO|nr:unnamed protein product [Clonostachys byssicola]
MNGVDAVFITLGEVLRITMGQCVENGTLLGRIWQYVFENLCYRVRQVATDIYRSQHLCNLTSGLPTMTYALTGSDGPESPDTLLLGIISSQIGG